MSLDTNDTPVIASPQLSLSREGAGLLIACASLVCAACSGGTGGANPPAFDAPVAGVGAPSLPGTAISGAPASAQSSVPMAGRSGAMRSPVSMSVGAAAHPPGAAGASATPTTGSIPMHTAEDIMAMTGADHEKMMAAQAKCKLQVTADARDDSLLDDEPEVITVGFFQDTQLPQPVLDWMDELQFAEAHDGWHLVRKWDQSCRKSNADTCFAAQRLVDQGLHRAAIQQGAPGDGVAFMMMHRNMLRLLTTAFPKHADLFKGFDVVPRTTDDAENPQSWHQVSWTQDNLQGFDLLEHIEDHLDMFETEDELGQYIENSYRWTADSPTTPKNAPGSGVHGALHSQWSVPSSPANLIDQSIDVKNFVFWKLHGWIDQIWERYRHAKGLSESDPDYQSLAFEQCMEMFLLEPRNRNMPAASPSTGSSSADPTTETGEFATMVRPFLDSTCGGCHSAMGPSAGLTLGGAGVSSAEIIAGIVSQKASNAEYALVEPGAPEKSWVYLKASGDVASATCTRTCNRQTMPPSGTRLSAEQLAALRHWIMGGATTQ